MYVITFTDSSSGTKYYFSYYSRFGFPVYVPDLAKARKFDTRKEASFDKRKTDKIEKIKDD